MATSKLSPAAALKLAELESFVPQVMRLNTLVEQYATAKVNAESHLQPMKRTADQLKLKLMGVGLDQMSQIAGSILMAASRSGNQNVKARTLRELIGNLRFQLDLGMRTIIREDELAKQKHKAKDEEKPV